MNMSVPMQRYLKPTSRGVFNWLSKPEGGLERRLFEHLVCVGRETPLGIPEIAEQLSASARDLAKALFALNRSESLSLIEPEQYRAGKGWGQAGLAEISQVLAQATKPGQYMLLSTDGFQIARIGCSAYEGDVMSVRQEQAYRAGSAAPELNSGNACLLVGARRFYVNSSAELDRSNPIWVNLAYRLLTAFCSAPLTAPEGASPC